MAHYFNPLPIAPFIIEAIEKTCVNCGEVKELCRCGNFMNFEDKIKGDGK
jgi:hypothetical protein